MVTSILNASGHLIDVRLIIVRPEAALAELQFNVATECEHANCQSSLAKFARMSRTLS